MEHIIDDMAREQKLEEDKKAEDKKDELKEAAKGTDSNGSASAYNEVTVTSLRFTLSFTAVFSTTFSACALNMNTLSIIKISFLIFLIYLNC